MEANDMRVALCAIAKDEDNYIGEWIRYYLKLGIDEIFIYQNDWRCGIETDERVHLIEFDGECKLLPAYNDFISRYHDKFDFACVFDIDEFLALKRCGNIKEFLKDYVDKPSVSVNWRLFGDSGIASVENGDYSLVNRFVRCGRELNHHVKQIINFRVLGSRCSFINPHFLISEGRYVSSVGCDGGTVSGPFNERVNPYTHSAFLAHYCCKTKEEWMTNRMPKGKCDFVRNSPARFDGRREADFDKFNQNDVEELTVKNFLET